MAYPKIRAVEKVRKERTRNALPKGLTLVRYRMIILLNDAGESPRDIADAFKLSMDRVYEVIRSAKEARENARFDRTHC